MCKYGLKMGIFFVVINLGKNAYGTTSKVAKPIKKNTYSRIGNILFLSQLKYRYR